MSIVGRGGSRLSRFAWRGHRFLIPSPITVTAMHNPPIPYNEHLDLGRCPNSMFRIVPRLLAMTRLAQSSASLGFEFELASPYAFDVVWAPGGTALATVAEGLHIDLAEVRRLNPHLIRGVIPPGGAFALRVPVGRATAVVAALRPARRAD